MTIQTLNRASDTAVKKVLCHYHNDTHHIQVARIENIPHKPHEYLERVVFPGNRLVFETFPHAWLNIYTGELCSALLAERILCDRLRLTQ